MPAPARADARRNVDALLDAGVRVLLAKPDAGLAHVAREAGVTRTTLYAHFPSREALLDAIVQRAVEETFSALDDAEVDAGEPADALVRLLETSWATLQRHVGLRRITQSGLGAERLRHHHRGIGA